MPAADLKVLARAFVRLKARWARQGRRVRQLSTEANRIAKTHGSGSLRGSKRRHAPLEAAREEIGYHAAWARWSATADELAALAEQIGRHPAHGAVDLLVKFHALEWALLDDGVVMDDAVKRQIVAYRRAFTALVQTTSP